MYTTEGLILKRSDLGEADSLFTIYTRDFGKIRALAQGIKKRGAKLRGHLEPLSLSSISFVSGRNGPRLTSAVLQSSFPEVRSFCDKLSVGLYMASLIDKECLEGEKDESLWEFLRGTFFTIGEKPPEKEILIDAVKTFEKEFALHLGYGDSGFVFSRGTAPTRSSIEFFRL